METESLRETLETSDFFKNLTAALSSFPLEKLVNPTLVLRAFVQERDSADGVSIGTFEANEEAHSHSRPIRLLTSHKILLRSNSTCTNEHASPSSSSTPTSPDGRISANRSESRDQTGSQSRQTRKRQGGLRLAAVNGNVAVEENSVESESPRQMQIGQENFPKRAKVKHDGVFHPRESSLGKFVVGVWEQIHSGLILEPHVLSEQGQLTATSAGTGAPGEVIPATADVQNHRPDQTWESFSRSNLFCRRVTQASRTCRSIEVIVQARWVELFDSYAEHLAGTNPGLSTTKSRMRAISEACADFGWTEKELRNKMAIWRGYKEIKDVLGWVALIFSGMGLYRLCKYRIDFDKEKFSRARALRMRMEVAADTLHHNWRQLLAIVGEPTERRFVGHPHDWVVHQDGSDPVPLRSTYLTYDPNFTFEHLDESVIDIESFGADDPRWTPPSTAVSVPGSDICNLCSQVQSNEAAVNACKCFPSLFGAPRFPTAVQVFRTSNGRNNGLQALVAFERGAAIGEFVGLITKDIEDQDVLDSKVGGRRFQIWQGRQGNFTRFANHSCKPNAQFEKFVWLGTQHILLVSKGIEAGMEITVDYSESYWRGLDKKCLCGESCCRYKKNENAR
ncbi:SET domain-containing protein [Fusarium flagelliforme]|uniref:SET domain-containing protein n=1 Tax=Fusarium flagelliforme TaxID=2675880 RepID=UPI001E8E7E25|nr:SET domain-containing protein [Fusarium flagelliforme]KAH7185139.1 SET domain-containing protein [Fusarium flagelliforme]